MPESTTAIAGTEPVFGASPPLQPFDSPVSYGQSCPELNPLTCTWTSGVTTRFGIRISFGRAPALTVAETPSIRLRRRSRPPRSSSAYWLTCVNAESAGESRPLVLRMITCTYWFGCRFDPFRRPGEIHVFASVRPLCFACRSFTALDARGTLIASIAASAVTAPRPPFPQSALERDSPPRLPVPHSALERVSPRFPPFIRTFRSPFRALARAAFLPARPRYGVARRREIRAEGTCAPWGASSPAGGRAAQVPSNE
jgi:hypothetical protein